ncbi:uncharacterized protein TRIADDRAFT_51313 [Trichoplax adhaerens]|uniref:ATP synthase subunit n=1 Tax=Trichoplax adhaerens TaxID=10228 RepID=B3RIG8_TRIAD|nr:hypothetical protein TRIADDRAFT_51313 [Trichoplax adhaerens]EDV28416.1 hypothetical protein TRIADDRAFT_51313 [Trichoplax adhaerens]|eukprot:XP_002107618.1 hypothetical protein TRIADDRAFT_51313 [Trichoplax adhaerens]
MAQKVVQFGQRFGTRVVNSSQSFLSCPIAIARAAQPRLATAWSYAKVEMRPAMPSEWPAVKKGFSDMAQSAVTGRFLDYNVRQVTQKALVFVEVCCWFYVGEIIGRRSIIGYNV